MNFITMAFLRRRMEKNLEGIEKELVRNTIIQTPASQNAKDKKLPIYEERRKPGLSRERQIELEKKMEEIAEAVPYPKNIVRIKLH